MADHANPVEDAPSDRRQYRHRNHLRRPRTGSSYRGRLRLDESTYEKPQLSVEDTTEESEKFGVIGALAQLVDRENLDDDTLVIAGDNVISFDIAAFLDAFEANADPTLAAYDVGSYDRATEYGLVELNDDFWRRAQTLAR